MNLRINILDKYIIKKFIGTYFFAILIFIVIVIIFDISEKIDEFVEKGATLEGIVFQYYANFIPYFMNMFNPLFVFIAVIFFTSKLASHSEIIAMLAGGVSFKRLLYPYFLSSLVIALLSLFLNLVVIPPANKVRLEFQENYISDKYVNTNRDIHFQLSPGTYVYMESFNSWNNTASRFTLETIQGHTIVSKLSAETAVWDTTIQGWKLYNYFLRKNNEMGVDISSGKTLDTVINLSIKDLNQRENIVESYNYNELNDLIDTQKLRGDKRVIYAQIEKHKVCPSIFCLYPYFDRCFIIFQEKERGYWYEHWNRIGFEFLLYFVFKIQPDVCACRCFATMDSIMGTKHAVCIDFCIPLQDCSKIEIAQILRKMATCPTTLQKWQRAYLLSWIPDSILGSIPTLPLHKNRPWNLAMRQRFLF